MDIQFDRYSLKIDGERVFIRSGAIHYFRVPSQALWRERLYQLKAAGYNTVDIYFCWDYHSPEPGVYDFEGIRDVRKLLEITQELGLYVIARPGPYINAEYRAGGLPGWLNRIEGMTIRNRTKEGALCWSEPYMNAVRQWWGQILPIIAQSLNVIMMQIENEYATLECEPDYMQALYDLARELGVTVPLSHNDLYIAGLYEDVVDLYAFDHYSVTQYVDNWRDVDGTFSIIDNVESNLRPFCQDRPLVAAEFQGGWFCRWKGNQYKTITDSLTKDHINITTKSLIGQGCTVFNHYMAIGGTNWGYMGSTDTYTSYDFAAPISEAGINTERLFAAKNINYFLSSFDLNQTDRVSESPTQILPAENLYAVRHNRDNPSEHWLFIRNLSREEKEISIGDEAKFTIAPFDTNILPYQINLRCGSQVEYSTGEFIYQTSNQLVVRANRDVEIKLLKVKGNIKAEDGITTSEDDGIYRVNCPRLLENQIKSASLGELTIYFIGEDLIDRFWVLDNGTFILGPDYIFEADSVFKQGAIGTDSINTIVTLEPDNNQNTLSVSSEPETPLPTLEDWSIVPACPELYDISSFKPIIKEGMAFDHNHYYEGSGWYLINLEKRNCPKTMTIDARHIWAVFINGKFLSQGEHWDSTSGVEAEMPETIEIPHHFWNSNGQNATVIFADSLGHPKGFHDDGSRLQGLLKLQFDDQDVPLQNISFSPGLQLNNQKKIDEEKYPIVCCETEFTLPQLSNIYQPIGLSLGSLPYKRVNVYINETLIGRAWNNCQKQTHFYLPDGFLKFGENKLQLALMNFDHPISTSDNNTFLQSVFLEPFGTFTKTPIPVKLKQ